MEIRAGNVQDVQEKNNVCTCSNLSSVTSQDDKLSGTSHADNFDHHPEQKKLNDVVNASIANDLSRIWWRITMVSCVKLYDRVITKNRDRPNLMRRSWETRGWLVWRNGNLGYNLPLFNYMKGNCSKVELLLFSLVTCDGTRQNSLKLQQERFR